MSCRSSIVSYGIVGEIPCAISKLCIYFPSCVTKEIKDRRMNYKPLPHRNFPLLPQIKDFLLL